MVSEVNLKSLSLLVIKEACLVESAVFLDDADEILLSYNFWHSSLFPVVSLFAFTMLARMFPVALVVKCFCKQLKEKLPLSQRCYERVHTHY